MAEASSQPNAAVLAEELASIAARAQTYTGASGAAIALSEGDITSMTCRAASGPAAPDPGAQLRLEGTFTGMAVQSGQALRCDDSDNDKRVDAGACRALGTRAIVVVPIRDADTETVIGVLAVFSGTKNAFNDLHVAVLRTMAREVAVSVQKAKKAGIPLTAPVDPPVSAAARPAARPVSDPGFKPPIPATPPRPVTASVPAAAAAPKPAPIPNPESVGTAPTMMSLAPKLAPPVPPPPALPKDGPAPLAEEVFTPPPAVPVSSRRVATPPPTPAPAVTPDWKPAPPPPPRKFEAETPKAEAARPVTFGTFDSVAQDKKPGGGGMGIWIGVGAAAVLIIGGYFGYSHYANNPATPAPPVTTTQAQPAPTTSPAATPSPSPATTPAASQPAPAPTQAAAKPATTQSQPQAQEKPQSTPPPPKPSPQAVERAAVTPVASSRQDEAPKPLPAPAQAMAVPIATSAPTLASPPPKVSQSTPAQLVSQVSPKYPEMARTMHAGGDVLVQAIVGKDGAVKDVKALSGNSLLREAATSAVRQWRYKPATLNGEPVETTLQITIKFGAPR